MRIVSFALATCHEGTSIDWFSSFRLRIKQARLDGFYLLLVLLVHLKLSLLTLSEILREIETLVTSNYRKPYSMIRRQIFLLKTNRVALFEKNGEAKELFYSLFHGINMQVIVS